MLFQNSDHMQKQEKYGFLGVKKLFLKGRKERKLVSWNYSINLKIIIFSFNSSEYFQWYLFLNREITVQNNVEKTSL